MARRLTLIAIDRVGEIECDDDSSHQVVSLTTRQVRYALAANHRRSTRDGSHRPRRKEQDSLGSRAQSRWEPRLPAQDSTEGEPCSMGGQGREQRGNAITTAIRSGVFHDHPRLARQANSGLRSVPVAVSIELPARLRLRPTRLRLARTHFLITPRWRGDGLDPHLYKF